MKKRFLYCLLFGAPGFLIALVVAFFVFGAVAGVLWVFVLGDNPWPDSTDHLLPVLFGLVFFGLWIGSIVFGYFTGKKLEQDPNFDKDHLLLSAAATVAPILMVVLHQWSVGNIGPKPESVVCGDYCSSKGYAMSGMPPKNSGDRSCICYGYNGEEVERNPLHNLAK
jgi:hypothetical protein